MLYHSASGGFFYFLRRTPKVLMPFLKKQEIRVSLRTRDRRLARKVARGYSAQLNHLQFLASMHVYDTARMEMEVAKLPFLHHKTGKATSEDSFSALYAMFLKEKRTESKDPRFMEKFHRAEKLFLAFVGDKSVKEVTFQDIYHFRDCVGKLPRFYDRKREYKHLTLEQLVQLNATDRTGVGNVNRHLITLNTFFNWLEHHSVIPKNPVRRMGLPRKTFAHTLRKAMPPDLLEKLLRTLASDADFQEPDIWWTFLIAMLSGLRFGEIVGLRPADLKTADGVLFFDLTGKTLKTHASQRQVPVHSILVDLGIMYRYRPDSFTPVKNSVYLGYKITRLFRLRISPDKTITPLHSFRHLFAFRLRAAGVEESLISQCLGHTLKRDHESILKAVSPPPPT